MRLPIIVAAAAALAAATPAHGSVDGFVATGPGGTAHFAWSQVATATNFQVHERSLSAAGSPGPVQSVSWADRSALGSHIGVDSAGNALIAWTTQEDGKFVAYARRRAADGALSPTQRISPAGQSVTSLKVGVEPDGDAVAVWLREIGGEQVVEARRRAAGGALGEVVALSGADVSSSYPDVAVAANGAATVTWVREASEEVVQARTIAPGGSAGEVQDLSAGGIDATSPMVEVDGTGRAVLGWMRRLPEGFVFEARARSATGTLSAVQTVAGADELPAHARMGLNAAGRVAFAWSKRLADGTRVARGRIRRADGTLGSAFDVSDGPGQEPRAAVDPNGHATFVYKVDGTADAIKLRRRSAAGAMGVVRPMSDPADHCLSPQLAVDGSGKAIAGWYVPATRRWYARTVTAAGTVSTTKLIGGIE